MRDQYGNIEANCIGVIRENDLLKKEIDEQRKVIEQQQFVLDIVKDWAYSKQKASVGYTKARMAIQALIKELL